jgi:hypothetical protein
MSGFLERDSIQVTGKSVVILEKQSPKLHSPVHKDPNAKCNRYPFISFGHKTHKPIRYAFIISLCTYEWCKITCLGNKLKELISKMKVGVKLIWVIDFH